jgi:23S rRNA pseudouridine1911/1915/1917 synthase
MSEAPVGQGVELKSGGKTSAFGEVGEPALLLAAAEPLTLRGAMEPIATPFTGELPKNARDVDTLYEDANVMVLYKPPGFNMTFGNDSSYGHWDSNMLKIVMEKYTHPTAGDWERNGGIAHRLDVDTSGCVLVGKLPGSYDNLKEQIHANSLYKEYCALVHGIPPERGECTEPIKKAIPGQAQFKSCIDKVSGRPSRTEFERVCVFRVSASITDPDPQVPASPSGYVSLLRLRIETGRTHQVRLHCAHMGHPLVSDRKYGDPLVRLHDLRWCPRIFLHHRRVGFNTAGPGAPVTPSDRTHVVCPLPPDLEDTLTRLALSSRQQDDAMPGAMAAATVPGAGATLLKADADPIAEVLLPSFPNHLAIPDLGIVVVFKPPWFDVPKSSKEQKFDDVKYANKFRDRGHVNSVSIRQWALHHTDLKQPLWIISHSNHKTVETGGFVLFSTNSSAQPAFDRLQTSFMALVIGYVDACDLRHELRDGSSVHLCMVPSHVYEQDGVTLTLVTVKTSTNREDHVLQIFNNQNPRIRTYKHRRLGCYCLWQQTLSLNNLAIQASQTVMDEMLEGLKRR